MNAKQARETSMKNAVKNSKVINDVLKNIKEVASQGEFKLEYTSQDESLGEVGVAHLEELGYVVSYNKFTKSYSITW